jgi:hypothetical protein
VTFSVGLDARGHRLTGEAIDGRWLATWSAPGRLSRHSSWLPVPGSSPRREMMRAPPVDDRWSRTMRSALRRAGNLPILSRSNQSACCCVSRVASPSPMHVPPHTVQLSIWHVTSPYVTIARYMQSHVVVARAAHQSSIRRPPPDRTGTRRRLSDSPAAPGQQPRNHGGAAATSGRGSSPLVSARHRPTWRARTPYYFLYVCEGRGVLAVTSDPSQIT